MKKKKIIITVVVVILLLAGATWFMAPRVKLYNAAKELTENSFPATSHCEYFNQFDITYASNQAVQTISYDGLSIDIPADWTILENSLEKGFNALGIPMPDSAYATMKSTLLLERDSYSLFNVDKTIAYYIVGMIKNIEPEFGLNYIYETEDICATYHVSPPSDEHPYQTVADVFSAKDLNKAYSMVIRTNSEETLYAMMNSVQVTNE